MSDHYVIRIYESELEVICDETFEHQKIETGGSLYGLFSHGGSATIFLATRPAGHVTRHETALELDPEVARIMENGMWETFGLQCLGMWHSHHWINLFEPSSGDRHRAQRLAAKAERLRHVEILANFVHGDGTPPPEQRSRFWGRGESSRDAVVRLAPFFYPDIETFDRAAASFAVIPGESPVRKEADRLKLPSGIGSDLLREARSRARTRYQLGTSAARHEVEPRASAELPRARERTLLPEAAHREEGREAPADPRPGGRRETPDEPRPGRLEPVPIPDHTTFLSRYVNPLMHGSGYEAELRPLGEQLISIIVHGHRHRAVFLYTLGWDGEKPFVWHAILKTGRQSLEWTPKAPEDRYLLPEVFAWGIRNLKEQ
ncbi:hypothetical protein GCM10022224_058060 [Nonomuraea antimicrobica]|uniref:JAB domain-containing protein n=1 Tax=Nonomuraea antimicrobica TaxID=561173 RepID=A0ABP7CAS0_9ACTN